MIEISSSRNLLEVDKSGPNPLSEFVLAAVHSGLVAPARGLAQIADHASGSSVDKMLSSGAAAIGLEPQPASFGSGRWLVQQLGAAAGMAVPFMLTRGIVQAGAAKVFGEAAVYRSVTDIAASKGFLAAATHEATISAATALAYGSVLAPSDSSNVGTSAFINERLVSGMTDAAVFGTLGFTAPILNGAVRGVSSLLERSALSNNAKAMISSVIESPVLSSAVAGIPAGFVSAEAAALKEGRILPDAEELKEHVGGMAIVGGAFGTASWLGAQREGSNVTNGRYLADRLGLTESATERRFKFRVVEGESDIARISNDIANGAKDAQATVIARQQIDTFPSALFGERFTGYGDTKTILLDHRGSGTLSDSALASDVRIATCAELQGRLAKQDLFPTRGTDATVWLRTDSSSPKKFELSLDRSRSNLNFGSENRSQSEVPLGTDTPGMTPGQRYGDGRFNVLGKMLTKPNDFTLLALTKDGGRATVASNDTILKVGLAADVQPYVQIFHGDNLWKLNEKNMQTKVSYFLTLGDHLLLNGKTKFLIENFSSGNIRALQLRMEGVDNNLRPLNTSGWTANGSRQPLDQAPNPSSEPVKNIDRPALKAALLLPNSRLIDLNAQHLPPHTWEHGMPRQMETLSNSVRLTEVLGKSGTLGADLVGAILAKQGLEKQIAGLMKALSTASFGEYVEGGAKLPKLSRGDVIASFSRFHGPALIFDRGRNIIVSHDQIKIETPTPSGQRTLMETFNSAGERTHKQYADSESPVLKLKINSRMDVITKNGERVVAVDNGYASQPCDRFFPPVDILERAAAQKPIVIADSEIKKHLGQRVSTRRADGWLIGFDKNSGEALVSMHSFALPDTVDIKLPQLVGELYPVQVHLSSNELVTAYRDATGKLVFDTNRGYAPARQVIAVSPSEVDLDRHGKTVRLSRALGLQPSDGIRAIGGYWAGQGSGIALGSALPEK